ncbi:MAG: hypothetical protein DRO96_00675 [Candidatus Aenigmatarchaeota archaeon]|nr:MAG: hypothetical protein DRO96_00675 [Candidatus Aenigmarchaeota archaeon]
MVLTFEKIRDIHRAEKESRKLEKLPDNIMKEAADYIERKQHIKEKTSTDVYELENIKNIIKDLFEIRERKILNLALYSVRTGLPVENLTKEEEKLFYSLVNILKTFREEFLDKLGNPAAMVRMESNGDISKKNGSNDKSEKQKTKKRQIRVVQDIPEFVGTDLKSYSLKKNDIISLDEKIENLLIKRGLAKVVD